MNESENISKKIEDVSLTVPDDDSKLKQERLQHENDALKERVISLKNQNKSDKQDRNERRLYAKVISTIVIFWLMAVLMIMIQVGRGNFSFSDSVIITLLTTTTIQVLGLFVIVANYLFAKNK